MVWKLDRLGRSIQGLISLAADRRLAAARKKGGIGSGRKSVLTPDKLDTARKLLAAGKLLQVGLSTFYRHFPANERASS